MDKDCCSLLISSDFRSNYRSLSAFPNYSASEADKPEAGIGSLKFRVHVFDGKGRILLPIGVDVK